jgi:hypothetical protein
VTSAEPSEANAIAETALKCAGHVRTRRPVDTSHTYAAPVTEPAAQCDPSGLAATTAMGSPTKNVCSGDSLSKPHTSRAFFETRAETAKIGIEGGGSAGGWSRGWGQETNVKDGRAPPIIARNVERGRARSGREKRDDGERRSSPGG